MSAIPKSAAASSIQSRGRGGQELLVVLLRTLQDPAFCDGSQEGHGFEPVEFKA